MLGAVSLEVGARAFNLHIQGVFEANYPRAPKHVKLLADYVRKLIPFPKGHKVALKPLTSTQTFVSMIGYVFKDHGKSHFRTSFVFNYSLFKLCHLLMYLLYLCLHFVEFITSIWIP
jgi:hypothetical protein